ncbi:flavodoxin domain-containing protein [Flavobacterium sp. SM15]|uniref:diflavin oxidoreductase n=1 Tax=Flavobacterium sp. SM15 TaxID=2908005 RepID=UPI001EDA184B|nr:flavodoxin domain-containing protein [Flavobacterium sp. SM15]MCG2612357.1 flavodoxin domain-containing protein [Flavobacterium sp. SM15]
MLSETKLTLLQQLVQQSTKDEIIWTKGYLAGFLANQNSVPQPIEVPVAVNVKPLIVYGTETGNAKKVATQLLANFKKDKIQAKTTDIFQFDVAKLEKETLVLFIVSTQGEGEFPQNAIGFYEKLKATDTNLNKLNFAVFGLGDSSYPLFCNAGVLLDEVLEQKGAKRLIPLVKADVDYSQTVTNWESDLKAVFSKKATSTSQVTGKQATSSVNQKKNYKGVVSHKVILNDRGSNKQTYHIEITPYEEVFYQPGDAIGFYPKNSEAEILEILSFFDKKTEKETLFDKNIRGLGKKSLESLSEIFGITITEEKADLLDILNNYSKPENVTFEQVVALLHPIAPRLYSISSDVAAHDGLVHITANLNTFSINGATKTGLCSQFLADFPKDAEIEFYIHKNNNFKLPENDTDIILIGPGTGIAPFRSFLAHRDTEGAEGKNWLFFGEQHFALDFYYQTEIQEWLTTGTLTKLDTAFSRDQEQKIYVQDRIREKAKEFNQWLENGASLYICGQKHPMSIDVENAVLEVIAAERNISIDEAQAVLEALESDGKYQKDVY